MVGADAWTAVGGIASVVAAAAALVTILYARATVAEARKARKEAHAAHEEELAAERAAVRETIEEQRAAVAASAEAHREEMADRAHAYSAELVLQRIAQVERIAQVLIDLIETARDEHVNPPPLLTPPSPFRATRIPALFERLRATIAVLDALGGPELTITVAFATAGYSVGTSPMAVLADGREGLREIERLARADERLQLPSRESRHDAKG